MKRQWTNYLGFVRDVCITNEGDQFYTCGDDKSIHLWSLNQEHQVEGNAILETYRSNHGVHSVDAHWEDAARFATCGEEVGIWDKHSKEPLHRFSWGADAMKKIRWNPAQTNILAGTGGSDRTVVLYDARQASPLRQITLEMKSNSLAWNPLEPFNFTVANEDSNCYTFDMRKMNKASIIHKDHVGAVLDVSYSPTGREFATASYDKSVRIFSSRNSNGRSREIYTTQRMHRVFCVAFTGDSKYILSGSDDTNVRIWKSHASRKVGTMLPKEREHIQHNKELINRYGHLPEIKRIVTKRQLPKRIFKERAMLHEQKEAKRAKIKRIRQHTKKGSKLAPSTKGIREKAVLKEHE